MSYRVKIDDTDILDYDLKDMVLIEPKLEPEVNEIDSFEFKMPPIHKQYQLPQPLKSTVEVYEDDDLVWFGRVMSVSTDYYRQKEVVCEGPLGWFKDTIQRIHEYESVKVHTFFTDVITNHNLLAPENRRFQIGNITVENADVYRKLDYNTTYDALITMCVNAEGGYLFFRRENGVNYIDWLKDMPYTCNQPVEFGLNLIDINSNFDGTEIITAIIPLGDTVQANDDPEQGEIIPETDDRVGKPLTLAYKYGSDIVGSQEAIDYYGYIIEAVSFSGVKDADELYEKAVKYLEDKLYNRMTFECTAVELKSYGAGRNDKYDHFKIGQKIKCKSIPHALDEEFPLLKASISLDSAAKEISLGTMPHQSLTKIINTSKGTDDSGKSKNKTNTTTKQSGAPTSYSDALRVDTVPTKGSDALITSGAVAAYAGKGAGGDWNPVWGINFDFRYWATGTLVETIEDQVVHHFSVLFDNYGRPIKFTDQDGHESNITW